MSSSTEAEVYVVGPPEQDWRDKLIEHYESQGFVEHLIIAQPPTQPTHRVVKRRETHDYYTKELPWKSAEDELLARQHSDLQRNLYNRYGFGNVTTAFPTTAMIAENPEYGSVPHHMFMVRPPENSKQEPEPQETVSPIAVDEQTFLKRLCSILTRA